MWDYLLDSSVMGKESIPEEFNVIDNSSGGNIIPYY
jgi:hypothetical protein